MTRQKTRHGNRTISVVAAAGTALLAVSFIVAAVAFPGIFSKSGNDTDKGSIKPVEKEKTVERLATEDNEIRGVWIATVNNINFPSRPGLGADELSQELDVILSNAAANHLNTIFFQVRPSSDAFYTSEIYPTSEFLVGTQGEEASLDVLKYLVDAAAKKNISVYAWVNPMRASTSSSARNDDGAYVFAPENPAADSSLTFEYNGLRYYNIGLPSVRETIAAGVEEIVRNYGVAGVVFDDYFYPYPKEECSIDDSAAFEQYGDSMSQDDWRRSNVNSLVKLCYDTVKAVDANARFGISPFGIWQNDNGSNGGSATRGLSAYSAIYCDALAWINGGYIDFIAPQIYWSFDYEAAPFATLADWWESVLLGHDDIELLISHAAYRVEEWSTDGEIMAQVEYARGKSHYKGSVFYGYSAICADKCGLVSQLNKLYAP